MFSRVPQRICVRWSGPRENIAAIAVSRKGKNLGVVLPQRRTPGFFVYFRSLDSGEEHGNEREMDDGRSGGDF